MRRSGTENLGIQQMNLGTHGKDTQYRPMCAVTAMYYFFHQKVDTQNIQEIGVPFQTSNWDFFPGDSVFI